MAKVKKINSGKKSNLFSKKSGMAEHPRFKKKPGSFSSAKKNAGK